MTIQAMRGSAVICEIKAGNRSGFDSSGNVWRNKVTKKKITAPTKPRQPLYSSGGMPYYIIDLSIKMAPKEPNAYPERTKRVPTNGFDCVPAGSEIITARKTMKRPKMTTAAPRYW